MVFAEPKRNECDDLVETFLNSRFSLRICDNCDKVRILGKRAAQKYPLCFYTYNGEEQFLRFCCKNLFKLNCDSREDLHCLDFQDIKKDTNYIVYSEELGSVGYLVKISEIVHDKNYAKVEVIKSFGSKTWCISNVVSAGCDWLNNVAPYKWRIGTLTALTGRWKANSERPVFKLCQVLIDNPHEANCVQAFYDTHVDEIDYDDPSQEIMFGSLLRVRNIHKLLSSLSILFCTQCKRNLPGVDDLDQVSFTETGPSFGNDYKSIQEIYETSEVVNTTNMFLDDKFRESTAYSSSNGRVTGVCTECADHCHIDDNDEVTPVFLNFRDSQSSQSRDNSQQSETNGATNMPHVATNASQPFPRWPSKIPIFWGGFCTRRRL